jgi:RNA polymerase sigma-70 factor (ECF subfamily)
VTLEAEDILVDADEPLIEPAPVTPTDFRALYEENVAFVWRNLRRLGVWPSELEDRTQEVFIVAFRRLATFEERGFGVRAWLFQILLRVASDARRHRRRHPEDATDDLGMHTASEGADPGSLLERRRAVETLDRALETIDVGRRAVLVLHEIEEMSAPEIAKILEIPVNTVYSRLRVARAELEIALRAAHAEQGERGSR